MSKIFSERLKSLRKELGLSQQALAAQMGVKRYNISDWEQGRTEPDLDMTARIARFFDVSADELLGI